MYAAAAIAPPVLCEFQDQSGLSIIAIKQIEKHRDRTLMMIDEGLPATWSSGEQGGLCDLS